MRITYYFDGDEFMFGEPHQVRAETVYLPVNTPSGIMPGHAFPDMDEEDDSEEYAHDYREMVRGVSQKPHGDCGCGCSGAGTCGVSAPSMSWSQFKERTPGAHLFVRALGEEKSDAIEVVKTVCDYHGIEMKELEDGVAIPFIDSLSDDGYEAVMTVASNMSEGFDAKGIGGKIRRVGQMANNFDRFDPNAIDADGDRVVQEGTRFQRPGAPKAPQMMPKVKPIQVPRREDVPIKPSVPSTPTPVRPTVPSKPKVPAGLSGSMGAKKKKAPNMLDPDFIDDLYDMDPDDAWTIDLPEDMFDELNYTEAESLLYEMKKRWKDFAIGMSGQWNDSLADRLMYEDEDGVIKHLMRWEDLSKAKAKKEAERLQDMWNRANAVENVHYSLRRKLQEYIAEMEKAMDDEDY